MAKQYFGDVVENRTELDTQELGNGFCPKPFQKKIVLHWLALQMLENPINDWEKGRTLLLQRDGSALASSSSFAIFGDRASINGVSPR